MLKTCLALTLAAALVSGCHLRTVAVGETRHETAVIDLDPLDSGHVDLRMDAGELRVTSGTPKLVDARFAFNVEAWRPNVTYHPEGGRGDLTISQGRSLGHAIGRTENTWDVALNDQVPLDVEAHLGAGQATLELGPLNLRHVEVHLGAGEVTLNLRGTPTHDYDVEVHGGVGQATIQLPKDVAILARASGALGSISASGLEKRDGVWINPDRLDAPVTVRVSATGAVGENPAGAVNQTYGRLASKARQRRPVVGRRRPCAFDEPNLQSSGAEAVAAGFDCPSAPDG